jgi:pyruvate,orthophosphate dikinase
MSFDERSLLEPYSGTQKEQLMGRISAAEAAKGERSPAALLERIGSIAPLLPDDAAMIGHFFGVIEEHLTAASASARAAAVIAMFSLFPELSPDAHRKALQSTADFLRRLIELRTFAVCREMLERLGGIASPAEEAILFNPAMAASVLHSGDEGLKDTYTTILKKIVIPAPKVMGFSGDTWAEIVTPLHLERLSRFLAIIRIDSRRFRDVLIHVIGNLYAGGVLIPDEKLFQREVSEYLNTAAVGDDFLLHSILLRKLPVYYNEVGAFGAIRDDSTELDSWGNDPLLYFLRKQVHVNASNHNIRLIEEIIRAWVYQDPMPLKDVVPEDVFDRMTGELLARYSPVRTLFETLGILDGSGFHVEKILLVPESELRHGLEEPATPEEIGAKIVLLCRLYREIVKKYSSVPEHVETKDIPAALSAYREKLRRLGETVLSPEKTTPQEALFFKRHIAFGIPSVMGSYHEPKFDAFAEMLRTEDLIRIVLEKLIDEIGQQRKDFAAADVVQWISCLGNIGALFAFRGLQNFQMDEVFTVLGTNRLHYSQVIDLLRVCQKELAWTVRSLQQIFQNPLTEVLDLFPPDTLPERLKRLGTGGGDFTDKAADIVMRDIVSSVAGLTELDRIFLAMLSVLNERVAPGSDDEVVPAAGPALTNEFFILDELTDKDAVRLAPLIGSKAKNLVYLHAESLRVPPAAIFPSSWTPAYQERTGQEGFREILRKAAERIGLRTGTIFGDDRNPFFLSVRSGSTLSMPGILSSILYCGMNDRTLRGLIERTGSPWLGWDSYRRFIEHYGTVVYGLDPAIFAATGAEYMKTLGIEKREDLSGDRMKELVTLLLKELSQRDLAIPEDVYDQLRASVQAVYASWYGARAKQFREAMGISGKWGTAVMLMEMVYGNDEGSGASVFFTRNPVSLRKGIYGDTKEKASGDDLVSGSSSVTPLTREQALGGRKSLEESDRPLFSLHQELASRIEEAMGGLPQEVEAVYRRQADGGRIIHVLQTRRMETHRGFTKRFTDVCAMRLKVIGRGAGVNGGQMSGVATFSSDAETIRRLKEEHSLPVILLRKTASTADVSLMPRIDGILTSLGGVASHASVLAQKFNLTAIVGCPDMEIRTDEKGIPFAQIGTHTVREGVMISIDGSTGLVYSGSCAGVEEEEEYPLHPDLLQ